MSNDGFEDESHGEERTLVAARPKITEQIKVVPVKKQLPYLVVIAGQQVGEIRKLEKELVIGRSSEASFRVLDDEISRFHAKVFVEDGKVYVEDMESRNGTIVNGEQVQRRLLADGDKIEVGAATILKFSYHDDLEENFQKHMYESAMRDGLTRAFNKKYFTDRLASEFAYSVRHKSHLSLILLDLDFFKSVNDTHGHLAGDKVLKHTAELIHRTIRSEDVFSRYGGEEFAILSRGIDLAGAEKFAERLRVVIQNTPVTLDNGTQLSITSSIGVASIPNISIAQQDQLIAFADEALYAAKHGGRNRVGVKQ